ncbi:MAG TPA: hypothetical protein VMZ29_01825 [Candidatus Bathyarchaeia archaeon]|nr:hypothetical protein [Candidatus Bathyarchaeia archaeon]
MAKNNQKKYLPAVIIGSIIILLTLTGGLIFGPFNGILPESLREKLGYSNNLEGEITVQLFVNFNGFHENLNKSIFFESNENATAFTILEKANLTLQVNTYQNGVFIEGIEGVAQNSEYGWWYQADGVDGGIASNKFDLRVNNVQTLIWLYKNY